mgnify:FL=1
MSKEQIGRRPRPPEVQAKPKRRRVQVTSAVEFINLLDTKLRDEMEFISLLQLYLAFFHCVGDLSWMIEQAAAEIETLDLQLSAGAELELRKASYQQKNQLRIKLREMILKEGLESS